MEPPSKDFPVFFQILNWKVSKMDIYTIIIKMLVLLQMLYLIILRKHIYMCESIYIYIYI